MCPAHLTLRKDQSHSDILCFLNVAPVSGSYGLSPSYDPMNEYAKSHVASQDAALYLQRQLNLSDSKIQDYVEVMLQTSCSPL